MNSSNASGQTAVIYARYSSHQQRDVSIEQQVNACKKYAQANNLSVIRVYDDHAMTGTNDNRPAFRQMIKDSASGAFAFVIVYTLDRFSRDRYDSAIHKHTLKEHGVKVLSAMENIQDNPVGVLMESVLEGFAEYYSKELAQKVKRGMRNNAEKCMVIGPCPLGYKKGQDGKYELIPEEASIVKEIFTRVNAGEPFVDIYADLNARGVTTKRGTKWDKNALQTLLHNEKYYGVYSYSDIRIEGGVPAIIPKELYTSVQRYLKIKPNAQEPQKRRRENGTYLLTGKLFCGHCKSPMIGVSGTSKRGALYYYYSCKQRQKDKKSCHKKPVQRDFIEELIARRIQTTVFDPNTSNYIADKMIEYLSSGEEAYEIQNYKARIAALEKEQANTLRAIRQGVVASAVQQMLLDIEAKLDSLKACLSIAQDRSQQTITKAEILALFEMFRDGNISSKEYQEKLIDAFLVRAYLYDDHLTLIFNYSNSPNNEIDIPFDADFFPDDPESNNEECSYNALSGVRNARNH